MRQGRNFTWAMNYEHVLGKPKQVWIILMEDSLHQEYP